METNLHPSVKGTQIGNKVESVLRKCVHCGFCNATCPTYELLGDELDGPRGRIYQMKQMFEGEAPNQEIRLHLDRCLTCRSCESTCPSGVEYGRLLEAGRQYIDEKLPRSGKEKAVRHLLTRLLSSRRIFAFGYSMGMALRGLLPEILKSKLHSFEKPEYSWPDSRHARKMIVLQGCVQSTVTPGTNIAAARVLDKWGISLETAADEGCCGAVALHTSSHELALQQAKTQIRSWKRYLDEGYEAIVISASGCGVMAKDYVHLLSDDTEYAELAKEVSGNVFDLVEIIAREVPGDYKIDSKHKKVAFQAPCTLQHGQQIKGQVESILQQVGYQLCEVENEHLCCGSAGTYSLLQSEISQKLKKQKLQSLLKNQPDVICSANIGCQMHLAPDSPVSVKHWIELLDG